MIWRLVGYTEAGDEVEAHDLSADILKHGQVVVICPLDTSLSVTDSDIRRIVDAFTSHDIHCLFFRRPIQLWKIEPPAPQEP
jgi:hypothetical protein